MELFAYSGKVRLIRALRDCKQRSLTVSKKAPTVSTKASPVFISTKKKKGGVLKIDKGARLRGRTATQRSKKGSREGFSRRVLGRGLAVGFTVKKRVL